jgi:hypothetical protein
MRLAQDMLIKETDLFRCRLLERPSHLYVPWAISICMTSGCTINYLFKAVLAACGAEIYRLEGGSLDVIQLFEHRPFQEQAYNV